MKSGSKTLHWDSPMLPSTGRAHFPNKGKGNTIRAVLETADNAPGSDHIVALDWNGQCAGTHIWGIHWATPYQNGFTCVYDPKHKYVRKMSKEELHRPAAEWGNDVKLWRLTMANDNQRPTTLDYAYKVAVRVGVVICVEMKSTTFALHPKWADYMVRVAKKHDHPAWMMTLYDMPHAEGKIAQIRRAGGQGALIFGAKLKGAARTAKFKSFTKNWEVKPNRQW